jgi:hypothetical protein
VSGSCAPLLIILFAESPGSIGDDEIVIVKVGCHGYKYDRERDGKEERAIDTEAGPNEVNLMEVTKLEIVS